MTDLKPLEGGGHFDRAAAEKIEEGTRWDGSNHISLATGSQWNHEELYLTRKGNYVIHSYSQWQGSTPSYRVVSAERAARWLVQNGRATFEGDTLVRTSNCEPLPKELAEAARAQEV